MFQPACNCCFCCNPTNGRVEFEGIWLIRSSFTTKDEHKAYQLTKTKGIFCKNCFVLCYRTGCWARRRPAWRSVTPSPSSPSPSVSPRPSSCSSRSEFSHFLSKFTVFRLSRKLTVMAYSANLLIRSLCARP